MNAGELWYVTKPIEYVTGALKEFRYREVKYGGRCKMTCYAAYEVIRGSQGGVQQVRVLRTRRGKAVRSMQGVGDLTDIIQSLVRAGEFTKGKTLIRIFAEDSKPKCPDCGMVEPPTPCWCAKLPF